jgi:CubicO group peptidase (beta-lactamase class C family)
MSMMVRCLFCCCIGLIGFVCTLLPAHAQTLEATAIPFAQSLIDSERVMGISVGVIAAGEQATIHLGHVAAGQPVANDETLYEIGSISKVFTGLLLADAVAGDQLALDTPVDTLLPEGVRMPAPNGQKITLKHLSTHRSGLPRLPTNMTELASNNPYAKYDSARAMEFLNDYQLPRLPGEKHEYSNFATSLLGFLVCEKAGQSYDEYLHETITAPLNMTATRVSLDAESRAKLATPHDASLQPTSTWEFADMPGAGGIRSNMADMLKFAAANLNPPANALGEAIELAWKQHEPGSRGEFAMGLGWHIAADGSTRWHNGGTGGYRSMMLVSRERGIAVVVMANTASDAIDPTAERLFQKLAGMNTEPLKFEREVIVDDTTMQRYVGKYQLAPTFIFDVNVVDGKLMVGITNQPTLQVFAKSPTTWFYKVVDAELTFQNEQDGKAQQLELFQNGIRQTAKRIESIQPIDDSR